MTFSLQKTAFFLLLLATQAFGRGTELTTVINNGVTLTATALTPGECLDTFYKNLHDDRIFPVIISIHNNSNRAFKLYHENININGATVLTPKKLDSEIRSTSLGALFLTIAIFPIGLVLAHQLTNSRLLSQSSKNLVLVTPL